GLQRGWDVICSRVSLRLELQLDTIRVLRRDHRQPPAVVPEGNVDLRDESEPVCVELQRASLIIDGNADPLCSHIASSKCEVNGLRVLEHTRDSTPEEPRGETEDRCWVFLSPNTG